MRKKTKKCKINWVISWNFHLLDKCSKMFASWKRSCMKLRFQRDIYDSSHTPCWSQSLQACSPRYIAPYRTTCSRVSYASSDQLARPGLYVVVNVIYSQRRRQRPSKYASPSGFDIYGISVSARHVPPPEIANSPQEIFCMPQFLERVM